MGTVERGESNLSFSNLLKVASALGISLAKLLEGIDQSAELRARENARKKENSPARAIRRSTKGKS